MTSRTSLDHRLVADEARRAAQHQQLKSDVERDVQDDVLARAERAPVDRSRVEDVADRMRSRAVEEVDETDREVSRARGLARAAQVVNYVFGLVYGLLGVRFVLALLAARSTAGFVRVIVGLTDPLYKPFKGIVSSHRVGEHTIVVPLLVAIGSYALLHVAIVALFRLVGHRRTTI